jgi:cobalt-zinc-cadmium efflux system outer membrane protein
MIRNTVALIAVVLVFHATASEPLTNLTLDRAIEIAAKNNPRLAEAEAEMEAAKARAHAAGKLPNPEAIARMESAPFSSGTTSQAEYLAGVSQAIPLGGRLSAARKAEQAVAGTRAQELNLARFELTRAVRNAFATALFSSEVFNMQTNTASSLKELVRITEARVDAGDLAPLDLARIQAEEAQHRLELKEAARLHHEALDELATAMGDFRIEIRSLSGSLPETLQISSIKAAVFGGDHPAVAVTQSEVEAQRARLKQARAERVPDVNLDLVYRRIQSSRTDAFDVGVRIPIPLFDRNKRVRQAEYELRASEARLQRVQNQIGHDQHRLELALHSALETADLLQKEILPKTDKLLAGAEARFKAGDISLSDLLIIRREVSQTRLRYAETLRAVMEAWSGLKAR